jgi:hypothetical protein
VAGTGPIAAVGTGPYPRVMRYQLLTPRAPLAPGAFVGMAPLPLAWRESPPRWAEDPSGRHQWRFWNGYQWTDDVADDGEASTDPLP